MVLPVYQHFMDRLIVQNIHKDITAVVLGYILAVNWQKPLKETDKFINNLRANDKASIPQCLLLFRTEESVLDGFTGAEKGHI